MKKIYNILLIGIVVFVTMVIGCTEEGNVPHGSDGIAPGKVTVDDVVNKPGGATVYFTSPNDEDLLYVKAEFHDDQNRLREVKVSYVLDSLIIEGIGKEGEYQVQLFAVDRGENVSEPTSVTIAPSKPSINIIQSTVEGFVDYGGVKVSYKNPYEAEVSLNVLVYDTLQDRMMYRESFFTSQPSGTYSFRGYKSEKTKFGIYVEDRWENRSDTSYFTVTPIPDEFLDKGLFSVFRLPGDKSFNEYGFNAAQMWDGRWSDQWNCGHTNFEPLPHYLTIDLGVTAILSRFKLYQRGGSELYKHGNPKHFRIYGIKDINSFTYDPSNPVAGWTLLKDCHSFKPSGLPIGQVTAEDIEYQNKGEDFEFDFENRQEVRYIRIENIETWGEQQVSVIGELSFWGEILDNIEE